MSIAPFLNNLPAWESSVKNKHILFDADAVISILEYGAVELCEVFTKLNVTFCIIHPVYVELLKTDNPNKRLDRQDFLNQFKFQFLPLTAKEMDKAKDIQAYLLFSKSYTASPTDLYLGGRLSTLDSKNIYLFTSNLSDFPMPLYKRDAGIILQSAKSSKILHLLSMNHEELETISLK